MTVSLKHRAYNHIRSRLLEGSLTPGSRLSLKAMAKEIGISHIPIREAVSQLRSESMVDHSPGLGFFVREPSIEELTGLFQVREVLEGLAANEATKRMSHDEIDRLDRIFEQMVDVMHAIRDEGITEWTGPWVLQLNMLDLAFHTILVSAANNKVLTRVVSEQKVFSQVFGRSTGDHNASILSRLALICRGHYRVLKAVRRRDPEAAGAAMTRHVHLAGQYFLECCKQKAQPKAKLQLSATLDFLTLMEEGNVDLQAIDTFVENSSRSTKPKKTKRRKE